MQQAVLHHFPDAQTTYKFSNRNANLYFTRQCYEQFVATIPCAHTFPLAPISCCRHTRGLGFSTLSLTPEERTWLQTTCPYLKPSYLDYLAPYRFKQSQVHVSFVPPPPHTTHARINT